MVKPDGSFTYKGPIHAFQTIIRTEGGPRALYRGLLPNLVGVTPEKAMKLATNDFLREKLERPDGSIAVTSEMLAGGSAGFIQVLATNPMEIVKIRMQIQGTLPAAERQSLGQILSGLGVRGLYIGTPVTLLRDVPFSIVFFPLYANLKKMTADEKGHNGLLSLWCCGAVSGSTSAAVVTPCDVIKTRLQV